MTKSTDKRTERTTLPVAGFGAALGTLLVARTPSRGRHLRRFSPTCSIV